MLTLHAYTDHAAILSPKERNKNETDTEIAKPEQISPRLFSPALLPHHPRHWIPPPPRHKRSTGERKKKRKEIPRFRLTDRSTLTHIHPSIHSNKPAQRLLVKHLQWCGNVAVGGWLAVEVCIWFSQSVSQLVSQSASQNRQTDTCHPSFPSLESFRFH
jgi:hypothetical protein